jgi:hypothetical protein
MASVDSTPPVPPGRTGTVLIGIQPTENRRYKLEGCQDRFPASLFRTTTCPCSGRSAAGIVLQPDNSGQGKGRFPPVGDRNGRFLKQWCHFFAKQCHPGRKNR